MRRTRGWHSLPKQNKSNLARTIQVAAIAAIISLLSVGVAFADNVQNDVVAGGNDTISAGGSTTVNYRIIGNNSPGGDISGCNVDATNPATLTISKPAAVSATPGSVQITECGNAGEKAVSFASSTPGNHSITVTITGGKSGSLWNNQAAYTLTVNGAADSAAPSWECNPAAADGNWHNNEQSFACTASDPSGLKSGSPATFQLSTSVGAGNEDGSASTGTQQLCDVHDNCTTAGPITGNKVDRKAPTNISSSGSISDGDSFYFGSVPANDMSCTAQDGGSGFKDCSVSGYAATVGTHTLTATARDNVLNSSQSTMSYTALAWTLSGYYQPVDMGLWNTVKGGSTVPLKFEVFAGPTELASTSAVKSFTTKSVTCPGAGAPTDEIEFVTTGGTNLRYDSTGGQFVQNWQTPKKPGTCHSVTMETNDGSKISANFVLK
jgi:hypothetical protein